MEMALVLTGSKHQITVQVQSHSGSSVMCPSMDSECSVELPWCVLGGFAGTARHADRHVLEGVDDLGVLAGQLLVESDCEFGPGVGVFVRHHAVQCGFEERLRRRTVRRSLFRMNPSLGFASSRFFSRLFRIAVPLRFSAVPILAESR